MLDLQRKNWGTEWDCRIENLSYFKDEISFYFESSYTSPIEGINNISKCYPDLSFTLLFDFKDTGKYKQVTFKNGKYQSTNLFKAYSLVYILIISVMLFSPEIFN